MNNRGAIILALAGVCGLAAMFSARKVLTGRSGEAIPTQDVLVAVRPISVEETITDEMVKLRPMPRDIIPAGALTEAKAARGRWARIPLTAGDLILDSKLAPRGTPTGLIGKLRPGMRAITIRVDEQTGISGFILPEYRVEVLKARQDPTKDRDRARLLLRNVRVLASGKVIETPDDRSIEATTVTLEVTPSQAELLTAAMQDGPLSLALMPLNEMEGDAPIEVPPPPEPEPEAPAPAPAVSPVPPPQPILVRAEAPRPRPGGRLKVYPGRRSAIRIIGSPQAAEPPTADFDDPDGTRRPFRLDEVEGNQADPAASVQ